MSESVDTAAAARLIEALMTDARLRDRFRRDPVGTCRAAGLDTLADEMAAGSGKAMQTLDLRESRSSLAGVLMAAAVEGVAVWQVVEHAGDVGELVSDVLSQVHLPAIPDPRGGSGGAGAPPALAMVDGDDAAGGGAGAGVADTGAVTGDPGGGADAASAPAAATADADAPTATPTADSGAAAAPAASAAAATPASAVPNSDPPGQAATPDAPATTPTAASPEVPATTPASDPPSTAPSTGAAAEAAPATSATPAVSDVLASDRLRADDSLQDALRAGKLGEDAPAALQAAVDRAPIEARLSADGRAIEITKVDGTPVDDANVGARDLAEALSELPAATRPRTIGTPWAISAKGYTTGPELGDRLRLELVAPPKPEATTGPTPAPATPPAAPPTPPPAAVEPAPPAAAAASTTPPEASTPPDPATPTEAPTTTSARGAGRNDTLTLAVPRADRADTAPDANASLTMRAIDPKAEPAAAPPADAAADGVGALSPTDYPGDDASKAELAAWMGALAQKRGLPAELPVMAALVESGMSNLNYGDRDSIGFFQMRTTIWDKGEYAGYGKRPELQVKWFLDTAEDMRKNPGSIKDPKQFGEWVADIERPAAQFRWKYGARLEEAQRLLRQAGGASAAAGGGASAAADQAPQATSGQTGGAVHTEPAAQTEPAGSAAAPSSPEELAKAAGKAALANDRLHFDDVGVADLKAGKIDPRILAVLDDLSKKHEISVSCMRSDHGKFTAGGSVSNHFHGRGVDIATVDGERVEPGSPASRTLAQKIAEIDASYRPDEVGTPWALSAPGHFTDAGHQDHIHIAFKTDLPGNWRPPSGLLGEPAATRTAATPGTAAPAGETGAVTGEAARSDTLSLPAIADRQSAGDDAKQNASLQLPAITEEQATRAAAGNAPAGTGVEGPTPAVGDAPAQPSPAAAVSSSADAAAPAGAGSAGGAGPRALGAVAEAKKYLGTPYLWGGSSPKTGFDCSGLVQWAYAQQGIKIPRVTYDQIDAPNATKIGRDNLRAGDLVFFATAAGDVHHVGMSLGGDRFIHAPHTGDVVKYSSLKEPYYAQQFAGGRRFDQAAPVAPAGSGGAEPVAQRAGLVAAPAEGEAGPDPAAVEAAEAARVRDAAAARDPNSMVFRALSEQEAVGHRSTMQFLAAVQPKEAKKLAAAASQAGIDAAPLPQGAVGYPGDDAGREQLARWLASQARKHGLPPELPVMAALVESNVQNLNYGDRDSVGFFQMRTGIWDQGEYAGYGRKPELQAKWFIDHALAVKRSRLAAGDEDFGRDPSSWGEWIADVERPAEQYRGRYQLRLAEARRLLGR